MTDSQDQGLDQALVRRMTVEIVSAYVGNNPVAQDQVPGIIREVHSALKWLAGKPEESVAPAQEPAVSVRRSVRPDHLVCLEDGKKLKMLKRHLRAEHDMSPDEYRRKWDLGADYPMVAAEYATRRSEFAKKIGLGRKKGETVNKPGGGRRAHKAA